MQYGRINCCAFLVILLATPCLLEAENGSDTYKGGSFSAAVVTGQNIKVSAALLSYPYSTLSFACPITSYGAGTNEIKWTCAGGSISIASADKALSFEGKFLSGAMGYSGAGGGKGGHVSYSYQFSGTFEGTITTGGVSQMTFGSISQVVSTSGQLGSGSAPVTSGSFGWNSAYSPIIAGDDAHFRIVAGDNLTGANLASYGRYGSGTGEFESIAGLAQDSTGRIYISDSALGRIVRIDDLTGRNWAEFGSIGTGSNHFDKPSNLAIDSTGRIWVADSGNNRIVRIDDMTGKNFVAFGSPGSGTNQFNAPNAIAFDAQGRIYVADKGNNRIVRFDDLTGRNWASVSEVIVDPYAYPTLLPVSVAVDAGGRIYAVLENGFLVRFRDMTGANGEVSNWGSSLTAMSLDKSGTIYVAGNFSAGLAQVLDSAFTGYFASDLGGAVPHPSALLATASSSPPPAAPFFTPSGLNFGNANVGEPTSSQSVYLQNLGAEPLKIESTVGGADFPTWDNCPATVTGGSSCRMNILLRASRTGALEENLTLVSQSVHPSIAVALSGYGTYPHPVLLPGALTFDPQATATTSSPQIVTLTNSGTGPLTVGAVSISSNFTQGNNCGKVVKPGAGCTVQIAFKPSVAGAHTGALTFSDDAAAAGAQQVVFLSGTATAGVPPFTISPESLQFPDQQVNITSSRQNVTFTNSSAAALPLGVPAFSPGFSGASTCGFSLRPGASCVFSVDFVPTKAGPLSGTLIVPIPGRAALTVGLAGTGVLSITAPVLSVSPGSVNFGQVVVTDSAIQWVNIRNTSGLPTGIRSISLAATAGLSMIGNTCPLVLAGGGSCAIKMIFVPTGTTSLYSSMLTVTEGSGARRQIPIVGQAISAGGGGGI